MQSLKGSPAKNGVLAVRRNCLIVNEILDLPVWLGRRAKPVCLCASVLYASLLTGDPFGSTGNSGWQNNLSSFSRHRPPGGQPSAELPAAARRSMRPSYLPHAVLSRSILRLSFVILSQHLLTWCKPQCPKKCSRSTSINKCRAARVNGDSLSARHCITECIYSIYPGTKVWGSSAGHRSYTNAQKSRPEGRL